MARALDVGLAAGERRLRGFCLVASPGFVCLPLVGELHTARDFFAAVDGDSLDVRGKHEKGVLLLLN